MQRLKVLGLALVAVFAMGAVASASASALVWQEEVGGVFQEVANGTKVTATGKLKLLDKKGGPFTEEVEVECEGNSEGTVSTGGKDAVTAITATACKVLKGVCPTPVTAKAVNMPEWQTQLEVVGTENRDKITTTTGTKEVGWEVSCNGTIDKCTSASSSTKMANNANGTVEATFDANTPKANCSRGGAAQGSVSGTTVNKLVSGRALRIN